MCSLLDSCCDNVIDAAVEYVVRVKCIGDRYQHCFVSLSGSGGNTSSMSRSRAQGNTTDHHHHRYHHTLTTDVFFLTPILCLHCEYSYIAVSLANTLLNYVAKVDTCLLFILS